MILFLSVVYVKGSCVIEMVYCVNNYFTNPMETRGEA